MTHENNSKELEEAFEVARKELEKSLRLPYVKFPVAHALYNTWLWADSKARREEKALKFEIADGENNA